jgi:hypothetical protein
MTRADGLAEIEAGASNPEQVAEDVEYVIKKLDLTREKFDAIMTAPAKSFLDYPSYYPTFKRLMPLFRIASKLALPFTPPMLREMDARAEKA